MKSCEMVPGLYADGMASHSNWIEVNGPIARPSEEIRALVRSKHLVYSTV